MRFSSIATTAALAVAASAHGGIGVYTVGSTSYEGWSPYNPAGTPKTIQREYPSFNPLLIADLTTENIRCNNKGALGTGLSATIAAGAKLQTKWVQWTHRPASVTVYMAKCPSTGCNSWSGAGKVWFKTDQQGLVSGTQNAGKWAGDQILDTLLWTTTIPASLAPGEYLIRHELIAVHQANNPQFYPECAQLIVTGSGTVSPPTSALVSFPGAYSASDPGIDFNIDSPAAMTATTYPVPGPAVWNGSGSTAPSEPADPEPSTPAAPTTLVTSAVAAPTTPPTTCSPVAKYGQCGGKTYSGCTVCVSGSKCTANGDYYSQCV